MKCFVLRWGFWRMFSRLVSNVNSNSFVIVVRSSDRKKKKRIKAQQTRSFLDQMRITQFSPIETGLLGYVGSLMDGRELSPEVLLRVQFIEGYVEFLKVGFILCIIDLQQCSMCK